jgi:hypothetical protein
MIVRSTCVLVGEISNKGWYILDLNDQLLINCDYNATINFYSYILNFHYRKIRPFKTDCRTEFIAIVSGLLL